MASTEDETWFDMRSSGERIFEEIERLGATYRSEIAKNLSMDKVTIDRWLPRLEQSGRIEKINLRRGPESHIVARLEELKASGMKKNHFKNANWYRVLEDEDDGRS